MLLCLKDFLRRVKLLPCRFWMNRNVGNKTYISKHYIIFGDCKYIKIGDRCKIMAGARIETVTDYMGGRFSPTILIGDDVAINQNFHCTCASKIEIGQGTSITANCGIFDIEHPYYNININPRFERIKTKEVKIGKNCLIGMNSVILPGAILGDHVIVGANSTLRAGFYPSYTVVAGSPACIVKRYDFKDKIWKKVCKVGVDS